MINTPPSDRSQNQGQTQNSTASPHASRSIPNAVDSNSKGYPHDRHVYLRDGSSAPGTPRHIDDVTSGSLLPAASAAAALAQLGQQHKVEPEWESEGVSLPSMHPGLSLYIADIQKGWQSDTDGRRPPRSTIELPPIQLASDPTSEPFPPVNHSGRRDLLPSILSNSPPGRSSTLPPLQRPLGPSRPRKQSITRSRSRAAQPQTGFGGSRMRTVSSPEVRTVRPILSSPPRTTASDGKISLTLPLLLLKISMKTGHL
jgi:hypothetical protein